MPESKQKLVLGLMIEREVEDSGYMIFDFKVGLGFPSKDFVSNREIREALLKSNLPIGFKVGRYKLYPNKSMQGAYWGVYMPFLGVREGVKEFRKKGIAQLLEFRVLQKVQSDFPEVKRLWHDLRIAPDRENQLKKRGLTEEQIFVRGYSVDKALSHLREKIANDTLKGRMPLLKPNPKRRRVK